MSREKKLHYVLFSYCTLKISLIDYFICRAEEVVLLRMQTVRSNTGEMWSWTGLRISERCLMVTSTRSRWMVTSVGWRSTALVMTMSVKSNVAPSTKLMSQPRVPNLPFMVRTIIWGWQGVSGVLKNVQCCVGGYIEYCFEKDSANKWFLIIVGWMVVPAGLFIERFGVLVPVSAEIWFEISAPRVPYVPNTTLINTLTKCCQLE